MKKKNYYISLVLMLLFACTNENKTNQTTETTTNLPITENVPTNKITQPIKSVGSYQLQPLNNQLHFPVPPTVDYLGITALYNSEIQGKAYINFYDHNARNILFYDLKTQQLAFETPIAKDGPNGIPKIQGYHILSDDSILVASMLIDIYYIIDYQGIILDKFDYASMERENTGLLIPYTLVNERIFPEDDNLLVLSKASGYINDMTIDDYKKVDLLVEVNLNTKKLTYRAHKYPDFIENFVPEQAKALTRTYHPQKKELVYSFSSNENIHVAKTTDTSYKTFAAKSSFIGEIPILKANGDGTQWFIESPRYDNILYDKYRDVFYRIVYHGQTLKTTDNAMQLMRHRSPFSVMIIDSNYQVIGETQLADNTYYPKLYFVCEQGLAIATMHFKNPNLNEDYLSFDVFELTK